MKTDTSKPIEWVLLGSKKLSEENFDYEYYDYNDRYSYVKVWKTGLSAKEMKRRGHEGTFCFEKRIGLYGKTYKFYFKTKKQALKFLKEVIQ